MTAFNTDLLGRIERHLEDISRLLARAVAPVVERSRPGPADAAVCIAAARACAQVAVMIERRFTVFRADTADRRLGDDVQRTQAALTRLADLIEVGAARSPIVAAYDDVFTHLTAGILAVDSMRHPQPTW